MPRSRLVLDHRNDVLLPDRKSKCRGAQGWARAAPDRKSKCRGAQGWARAAFGNTAGMSISQKILPMIKSLSHFTRQLVQSAG